MLYSRDAFLFVIVVVIVVVAIVNRRGCNELTRISPDTVDDDKLIASHQRSDLISHITTTLTLALSVPARLSGEEINGENFKKSHSSHTV